MGALARPHKRVARRKIKGQRKKAHRHGTLQLPRSIRLVLGECLDPLRAPAEALATLAIASSPWVRGPKKTSLGPA